MDHITGIAFALFALLVSVCAISIQPTGCPHNDHVALLSRRSLLCSGISVATASTAVLSSGASTDTPLAHASDFTDLCPFQTFQVETDASLALGPKLASIDVSFTDHEYLGNTTTPIHTLR
jgi:hypothetical protein